MSLVCFPSLCSALHSHPNSCLKKHTISSHKENIDSGKGTPSWLQACERGSRAQGRVVHWSNFALLLMPVLRDTVENFG